VLDVPCGSGFYTRRLAERIGAGGRLTAVDVSDEYLDRTRERLGGLGDVSVELRKADAYALPFESGTFDLVWCAQSLISLDPTPAVREMFRVTSATGTVAILEGDEFHHVLLPWPVELEAALPAALLEASRAKYGDGGKLAPARRLRTILKQTGFSAVRRSTSSADRAAPFDQATTDFLREHFAHLRELVRPRLTSTLQRQFDSATDHGSQRSFFHRPDAEFTCINAVFIASARNSGVARPVRPARGSR
jgi:ubiquinone/menaquinone biosynthesis C-methylase UbiE